MPAPSDAPTLRVLAKNRLKGKSPAELKAATYELQNAYNANNRVQGANRAPTQQMNARLVKPQLDQYLEEYDKSLKK